MIFLQTQIFVVARRIAPVAARSRPEVSDAPRPGALPAAAAANVFR